MTKRKKTPPEIETDVLTMSARRCCVCFGVQMDLSLKKGQIAHLDHNPSNTEHDNLAYLCIPHHDDYDNKTSQSKGLTIYEVKSYRTLLYEAVRQMRNDFSSAGIIRNIKDFETDNNSTEISRLLSKVQSRAAPLSQCLVEGIDLARKLRDTELEKYCREELSGYADISTSPPAYRIVDVFISGNLRVNIDSPLWGNNPNTVLEYLRRDKENFVPAKFHMAHSISTIESQSKNVDLQKGLILLSLTLGDINPKAKNPNAELAGYAHPDYFQNILEAVRRELTVRLLNLLPNSDNIQLHGQ